MVKKVGGYSCKYGLGYLLNNGFTGVFFKDSSKIILNPNTNTFNYIEKRINDRQEIIGTHSLDNYPKDLQTKVTLLIIFKKYLEDENSTTTFNKEKKDKEKKDKGKKDKRKNSTDKSFIYVRRWIKTRNFITFKLSNGIVQVCFHDHTEIIFSSDCKFVTYVNQKSERTTYTLKPRLENTNYEVVKRIKYFKDTLAHRNQRRDSDQSEKSTEQGNKN